MLSSRERSLPPDALTHNVPENNTTNRMTPFVVLFSGLNLPNGGLTRFGRCSPKSRPEFRSWISVLFTVLVGSEIV